MGIGGRLIGAFAFGYTDVNVCLVGVQPIEYMRAVGQRTRDEDLTDTQARGAATHADQLAMLHDAADAAGASASQRLYLDGIERLTRPAARRADAADTRRVPGRGDAVGPMMLPMAVGSGAAADLFAPLLQPLGITPFASAAPGAPGAGGAGPSTHASIPGPGVTSGPLPSNVDASAVRLEPGSVLSIPLGYGDMDLAASGTVTDVLPDGTVLAFGHAMQAMGPARLPMATGFTHFVVSRNSISFKMTGTLDIVGSIVRDEQTAVAGVPTRAFFSAPVSVHVEMPGQPPADYRYHVVDAQPFTVPVLGIVAVNSVSALYSPPMQQTLRLTGAMHFDDGRTVDLDTVVAGEWSTGLTMDLLAPLAAVMNNPYQDARLESADLSIKVEDELKLSTLVSATLDTPVAEPGQTLNLTVALEPYGKPTVTRTLAFRLPSSLAEGEYQLQISGADGALMRMVNSRPDLLAIDDLDTLVDAINDVLEVDRDAIYVALPRTEPGVAIGGRALPELPSSRAAVLGNASTSSLQPYTRFVEKRYASGDVIEGELTLAVKVQHDTP